VCSAVTTANFERPPLVCEACGSPDVTQVTDPQCWTGDGDVIENWGALTLTNGHYRCPVCGTFELRFANGHGGVLFD
jgi:hypothetical protein